MPETPDHRWSGWPGAWCFDCGIEDQNEHYICNPCPHGAAALDEMGLCRMNHNPPCPEPGSNRHNPYVKPRTP